MRALGLDHLLVIVDGLEPAVRFYEQVAGATLIERLPEYAMAELRLGASGLALVDASDAAGAWAYAGAPRGRNVDHFCIAVEAGDEAAFRAHLRACNAAIIEEARHDDGLSLYVLDPSGNQVELKAMLAAA